MDIATPCCVLFDTLKTFGSISNKDAAKVILTDKPVYGGKSPRERIGDKSYLSRTIVHSYPGDFDESMFVDFGISAYTLLSKLKKTCGSAQLVTNYLATTGARDMASALVECSQDGMYYSNAVKKLMQMSALSENDRAGLLVMLFLATGCIGDPRWAAKQVFVFASKSLASNPSTSSLESGHLEDSTLPEPEMHLALFRVIGGMVKSWPYVLSTDPDGTEIGYLSAAANSINDVEVTVSRHHLRIWRATDGCWYAQGLESRNGTELIRDGKRIVIEPPRNAREGFIAHPVQLFAGDELRLARDTVFRVVRVDPTEIQ